MKWTGKVTVQLLVSGLEVAVKVLGWVSKAGKGQLLPGLLTCSGDGYQVVNIM